VDSTGWKGPFGILFSFRILDSEKELSESLFWRYGFWKDDAGIYFWIVDFGN